MAGNTVDIKGSRHDDNIAMAAGNSDGTDRREKSWSAGYIPWLYIILYIHGYIYMYINSTCVYVYNSLYIIII